VPPIIKTIAVEGKGEDELLDAIMLHRKYLEESGELIEKRRDRTRQETLQMIHYELFRIIKERLSKNDQIEKMVEEIMNHRSSPYNVVEQVVNKWLSSTK
jgi:LAO/AO transport system kinase